MKIMRQSFRGLHAWWMLAIVVAAVCGVLSLWWGSLNQDEGWYVYAAQLVRAGKMPYRDFFFTQGPTLPFVYSFLAPVWGKASPLHGLLGARAVTLMFGLLATFSACGLVRMLVPVEKRPAATLAVFALLSGNLYHVYFTTIPKTYALGSFFLLTGLLLLAAGVGLGRTVRLPRWASVVMPFAAGLAIAFASGTRISLILILPVIGIALLLRFRSCRWAFFWFGTGGAAGLFLTYGLFALDETSRAGLLAAQQYHAARGGFDPFFAVGAVSRLTRGYAALAAVLFAGLLCGANGKKREDGENAGWFLSMMGVAFAAVFLLQLSAPFPYDDYQVPLMGLLSVLVVAWFFRREGSDVRKAGFAVLTAGMVSMSSPMLQQWTVYGQDRFWSHKKDRTELSKLRLMAEEINLLDPGGDKLLTQDLYLAVEAGRTVPEGMEMGPFSYFPGISTAAAKSMHVMNTEMLEETLSSAPAEMAAFTGYSFAIAAPKCDEVPFDRQKRFFHILKEKYELADTEPNFGQNATTLLILRRKPDAPDQKDGVK